MEEGGRGGGGGARVKHKKKNKNKEEKPILLNNKTSSSHFTLGLKLIIKRQRQNWAIYQTPYTTRQYTRRPHVYKAPIHYTAQHRTNSKHFNIKPNAAVQSLVGNSLVQYYFTPEFYSIWFYSWRTVIDGHPEPRRFYRDMTSLVCRTVHPLYCTRTITVFTVYFYIFNF